MTERKQIPQFSEEIITSLKTDISHFLPSVTQYGQKCKWQVFARICQLFGAVFITVELFKTKQNSMIAENILQNKV